jgi:HK97 family phage prohead protease
LPWHIGRSEDCPASKPFAVIKDEDGSVAGCHATEAAARRQLAALYAQEGMNMRHRTLSVKQTTVTDQGVFSAILAAYSVDRMNDRIVPGAFEATITRWQKADRMLPLHWNHSEAAADVIGYVDPNSMRETDDGLYVEGKLDLEDSEVAREAWRSMRNDTIALSFGYLVTDERKAEDGVNELLDLDVFEATLTPTPVNADTRVLSMKSSKAWDGSPSRFTDEQYARSCVLDRAKCSEAGRELPAKQRYSLPIREPGGGLNADAVHAAAARINQVQACAEAIASAKAALRRAYGQLGEEAPDSIKSLHEVGANGEAQARRAQDPIKVKLARDFLASFEKESEAT